MLLCTEMQTYVPKSEQLYAGFHLSTDKAVLKLTLVGFLCTIFNPQSLSTC